MIIHVRYEVRKEIRPIADQANFVLKQNVLRSTFLQNHL